MSCIFSESHSACVCLCAASIAVARLIDQDRPLPFELSPHTNLSLNADSRHNCISRRVLGVCSIPEEETGRK